MHTDRDIARLFARLRELEAEARTTRDEIEAAIREATLAGIPHAEIADAAGEPLTTIRFFSQRSAQHLRDAQKRYAEGEAIPYETDRLPGMTPTEAAERLGITRQAVHRRIRLGQLRAARHGRYWRVLGLDDDE